MNPQYKVHWAGVAEEDLKGIIMYIAEDSPAKARTIFEKIKEKGVKIDFCKYFKQIIIFFLFIPSFSLKRIIN